MTKQDQYECLVEELFEKSKYSPLVRPVRLINETLTVNFSVQLSQIVDIVSIMYTKYLKTKYLYNQYFLRLSL